MTPSTATANSITLVIGQGIIRGMLVLWVAVSLVFVMLRILPGDGVSANLRQSGASEAQIREQQRALCLDCPIWQQYTDYVSDVVQGKLGFSTRYQLPVTTVVRERIGATLSLGFAAFGLALITGLVLGIAYGVPFAPTKQLSELVIVLLQAVPIYLTAIIGVYVLGLYFDWLPSVGSGSLNQLILPAGTLSLHVGGSIARVLGANLRHTLDQPYMLTARAKGLPPIDQLDHALRTALLPTLSVLVLQAGFLLSGTVIIEFIFVRPGLGSLLREAVLERDYAIVQTLILFSTLIYLGANATSNLLRYLLDPRLRIL
jgi:ABC-type dipeptide/oligopeptide/nickel transport system permease component